MPAQRPGTEAGLGGAASRGSAYQAGLGAGPLRHRVRGPRLPATPAALEGFRTSLAEAGKKVATPRRHPPTLSQAAALRENGSPTAGKQLRILLHEVRGSSRPRRAGQLQARGGGPARPRWACATAPACGWASQGLPALGADGAPYRRPSLAEECRLVSLRKGRTTQFGDHAARASFYSPALAGSPGR